MHILPSRHINNDLVVLSLYNKHKEADLSIAKARMEDGSNGLTEEYLGRKLVTFKFRRILKDSNNAAFKKISNNAMTS